MNISTHQLLSVLVVKSTMNNGTILSYSYLSLQSFLPVVKYSTIIRSPCSLDCKNMHFVSISAGGPYALNFLEYEASGNNCYGGQV